MKSFKIITAFLLVFTFSCQNDDDNSLKNSNSNNNPDVFIENFGNEITRNFLGSVIDQNENPIENVTITIGSKIAQTDANGVFIIRDANIYERFGYVKAEKVGYIHGSRSVVPTSGTNKITIMLLEDTVVGTTNSGIAETITLPNGASVALEGDYIKADGSTYSGSVNVIMHHLDPADENMANQMPGMLYAANANNEERMLQTFGMLAVELRGSGGEDLNLATGTTAEIKMPLDASLLANAPATIPLWNFDEDAGYWKEEGTATLVGDSYIGTVSHFSFWNCDIPAEAVNLCITVTDENGNPLSYVSIHLNSSNYGESYGETDSNGQICGLIPNNENLDIEIHPLVIGSSCSGESLYSSSLGPFSEDNSITIEVSESGNYIFETISGLFISCEGEPISEGYISLNYLGTERSTFVDNGNFEINLIRCDDYNTFHLQAYDYVNLQQTDYISYTFTTPITDMGTLAACNSVDELITYQVDGGNYISQYFNIHAGLNFEDQMEVWSYNQAANNDFYIVAQGNPIGVGTYEPPYTYLELNDDENNSSPNRVTDITILISAIGNVGGFIDINFSGTYLDIDGLNHDITGTINAIRDF